MCFLNSYSNVIYVCATFTPTIYWVCSLWIYYYLKTVLYFPVLCALYPAQSCNRRSDRDSSYFFGVTISLWVPDSIMDLQRVSSALVPFSLSPLGSLVPPAPPWSVVDLPPQRDFTHPFIPLSPSDFSFPPAIRGTELHLKWAFHLIW